MRKTITLYGEVAGTIWMPAVECTKEFHLELTRIPRNSKTRTYPGIAPRSMEITRLRDALLHLTNDGDFQSCAITWAVLEVSHCFGDDTPGTHTVKFAPECGNCAVRVRTLTVLATANCGGRACDETHHREAGTHARQQDRSELAEAKERCTKNDSSA